jgi:NAD(P)-dependent dehydrogenase (short-subunit alcohol dehydrogenase family)
MKLKPLQEQVVVVMGASSGLGREAALRFAGRGAKVVVAARGEPELRSLVEEIREGGGEATAVVADAAEFEEVQALADRAVEEYGRLDTWVHVAGVGLFAAFEDTTPEEFRRIIDVNLMGQVHGAMAALPHIKREGRGALIHISSMGAKRSVPLQSAYCASKHGMEGFIEALRVEIRREGLPIGVTSIQPATTNTPFFDKARTKMGVKPVAPPPIYGPNLVADAILHAAEHPARDIVVGGAAKAMILGQRLSPRLLDVLMQRGGFEVHFTDEPKTEDAPDNLYASLGYETVEGSFSDRAHPRSLYTWLELRPEAKGAAVAGAALGALALLRARS